MGLALDVRIYAFCPLIQIGSIESDHFEVPLTLSTTMSLTAGNAGLSREPMSSASGIANH
jgi:hypothetical protein